MKVLLFLLGAAVLTAAAPSTLKNVHLKPKQKFVKAVRPSDINIQQPAAPGKKLGPGDAELDIIHGNYASDGQIPYQALIEMDQTSLCGGSVISDTFILTAAQCASGYSQFLVMVGDNDRLFQESSTFEYAYTYISIVHEDYEEDLNLNDIGLLQLLFPLKLNTGVMPINLPPASDASTTYVGRNATISGWGTADYGTDTYELKFVSQPVMDTTRCGRFFGSIVIDQDDNIPIPIINPDLHICGDGEGAIGACGHDAGGPWALQEDDGTWTQIGISSFESDLGCTYGYPSVYTRVANYVTWINEKTTQK